MLNETSSGPVWMPYVPIEISVIPFQIFGRDAVEFPAAAEFKLGDLIRYSSRHIGIVVGWGKHPTAGNIVLVLCCVGNLAYMCPEWLSFV